MILLAAVPIALVSLAGIGRRLRPRLSWMIACADAKNQLNECKNYTFIPAGGPRQNGWIADARHTG